jgi:ribosomal protein S24E
MVEFQGFESFEVYADDKSVFVEQFSKEFGKKVVVEIPVHVWQDFVKAAEFEMQVAEQ